MFKLWNNFILMLNVFSFVFIFLFFSCGMDVVSYLEPPKTTNNSPDYNSKYDVSYFEFTTNDTGNDNTSDLTFLGTAVYYKIYNNYSTMLSNISSLSTLSSSTSTEAQAASRMIDSYKYQQLGTSKGNVTPLIDAGDSNKRVYIRLTNYNEKISSEIQTSAIIKYRNESTPDEWVTIGVPLRTGNNYTFDFGRDSDKQIAGLDPNVRNIVPGSSDDKTESDSGNPIDVKKSDKFSDDNNSVWYVDMYAVSVGRDVSFTSQYSNILHLGSVKIDASDENN